MINAPKGADKERLLGATMTGHHGGDSNHVVGVGRMPHPERNPKVTMASRPIVCFRGDDRPHKETARHEPGAMRGSSAKASDALDSSKACSFPRKTKLPLKTTGYTSSVAPN